MTKQYSSLFGRCLVVLVSTALLLVVCGACRKKALQMKKPSETLTAGQAAPQITLPDRLGKPVSLAEYSQGRLVLVNFWATFCTPCLQEMPALQQLHDQHKNKGFSVLSINTDAAENRKNVDLFLNRTKINFPVLFDIKGESLAPFGVEGFPESFFVSSGKIAAFEDPIKKEQTVRIKGEAAWDSPRYKSAIEQMLASGIGGQK